MEQVPRLYDKPLAIFIASEAVSRDGLAERGRQVKETVCTHFDGHRGYSTARGIRRLDLPHTPEMPSAFERGFEPDADDAKGGGFVDCALTKRKHIGVVVLSSPGSSLLVPAQGAPDAADFVGDHGFAVARATEHDAALAFTSRDRQGCGADERGIIYGRVAVRAEVPYFMSA